MLGIAGHRIVQLAILREVTVIKDQRNLAVTARQAKSIFDFVAEQKHAEQARVYI